MRILDVREEYKDTLSIDYNAKNRDLVAFEHLLLNERCQCQGATVMGLMRTASDFIL